MMMSDLRVRMAFASTPQAKGRVERHDLASQLRLASDIIRFGIRDYGQLDAWSDELYLDYLNQKFSYPPLEQWSAGRREGGRQRHAGGRDPGGAGPGPTPSPRR